MSMDTQTDIELQERSARATVVRLTQDQTIRDLKVQIAAAVSVIAGLRQFVGHEDGCAVGPGMGWSAGHETVCDCGLAQFMVPHA